MSGRYLTRPPSPGGLPQLPLPPASRFLTQASHTTMRKALIVVGSMLLIIVAGGAAFVASRQHLKFEAPYPNVVASADSSVIERGHYVVRTLAPCASCHGDPNQRAANASGAEVPLVGGFAFDIPPGTFYTRNLTPDTATGL